MIKLPELDDVRKAVLKPVDCVWMYNYRRLTTRITRYLVVTNIKANHVTVLSFLISLIGAYFFSLGAYRFLVYGAIAIQLGYFLDIMDGEIARFKKQTSKFGQWLDNSTDVYAQIAIAVGVTYGIFSDNPRLFILILGSLYLLNHLLYVYLRMLNQEIFGSEGVRYATEFSLSKRFYMGYEGTMYFIITMGALLNKMYYVLWFFATIWGLIWIKKVFTIIINKRNL